MIKTTPEEWADVYEVIKRETRKSVEKHVHIYVSAADADSVSSLRILEVRRFEFFLNFSLAVELLQKRVPTHLGLINDKERHWHEANVFGLCSMIHSN